MTKMWPFRQNPLRTRRYWERRAEELNEKVGHLQKDDQLFSQMAFAARHTHRYETAKLEALATAARRLLPESTRDFREPVIPREQAEEDLRRVLREIEQ